MAITRTPNTISVVGTTATVVGSATGADVSPGFPIGYTPVRNDVHVIHLVGKTSAASGAFTTPAGYTLEEDRYQLVTTGVYLAQVIFSKVLTGGDTSPTITVPASFNLQVLMAQASVWQGVSRSPTLDSIPGVISTAGVGNTGGTADVGGGYTVNTTAMVAGRTMVWVFTGTSDNNLVATGPTFTQVYSYDTLVGTDASAVMAVRSMTTGSTSVTFTQSVNFPDVYVANELQIVPQETVVEDSATSSGQGSGTATGVKIFAANGSGVGSQTAVGLVSHIRSVTGSGAGSQSATGISVRTRSASGSGVSGSFSRYDDEYPYRDITVDSSGYYFYEYLDFVLIQVQLSSAFSTTVLENVDMQTSASPETDFNVESSISIDYIISAGISISFDTDVSISTNLILDIDPEEIMTLVSVLSTSFEVLRPGGGEDTSDIKAFFILDDIPLTEHNRTASISAQTLNVNSSNWRGKKSVYYKIQPSKRVFTIQWTFVPGKRENTVDLNAGRDYIRQKSIDPSDHVLKIRNLDTNGINPHTTEVYNVLVAEYNETLVRRDLVGDDYYWDCTLSLKEV